RDRQGVAEAREMLDTAYRSLDDAMAGREWAAGDIFSLADCAAAPALFYADWAHPSARYSQMSLPIGDGCSRGLPLHGRWTRRGHIVHSSHSVRAIVTEKGVDKGSWQRGQA